MRKWWFTVWIGVFSLAACNSVPSSVGIPAQATTQQATSLSMASTMDTSQTAHTEQITPPLATPVISSPVATAAPVATAYQDIALPPPKLVTIAGGTNHLPPAWVIVGGTPTAGTYGSYTIESDIGAGNVMAEHGDAPPPSLIENLATTTFTKGMPVTIIVNSRHVTAADVRAAPWSSEATPVDPALSDQLSAQRTQVDDFTVLTVSSIENVNDQVLLVKASLENGEVSYLWRINPDS